MRKVSSLDSLAHAISSCRLVYDPFHDQSLPLMLHSLPCPLLGGNPFENVIPSCLFFGYLRRSSVLKPNLSFSSSLSHCATVYYGGMALHFVADIERAIDFQMFGRIACVGLSSRKSHRVPAYVFL